MNGRWARSSNALTWEMWFLYWVGPAVQDTKEANPETQSAQASIFAGSEFGQFWNSIFCKYKCNWSPVLVILSVMRASCETSLSLCVSAHLFIFLLFFGYWHRLIGSKYWKDHFNFNSSRMRLSAMNIMLALISLNYFCPAFRETSYRHSRLPAFKPFSGSSRGRAQHKRGNKRGTIIPVIWERLSGELHSGVRMQSFSSGSLHVWSWVRWILSEEPWGPCTCSLR